MKINLLPGFLLYLNINVWFTKSFSQKPHHSFSEKDLRRIFHVNTHAEVPEYAIIRLHSRNRRSTEGGHTKTVRLKAFGHDQILNLTPNEGLVTNVPVFFADPLEGASGIAFNPIPQGNEEMAIPYQDETSRAALMVSHHPLTGDLLLDGTIGEDLVVRPLPVDLHYTLYPSNKGKRLREDEASENALIDDDDEMFLDQGENLEDDVIFSEGLPLAADDEFVTGSSILPAENSKSNKTVTEGSLPEGLLLLRKRRSTSNGLHVVFKRQSPVVDTDYVMMEPDHIPARGPGARSRRKRDAPYVIYPEILVLVDYDGYLLHGQDNNVIKSYYVSFWNGVDLRYKLLKGPKVKISIAGIIISRSRDAMPYLERNRVGRDAIDSASALTDMGKYLYEERRLPTYDIAVAITKYDLCRRRKSGNCTTGTAGFAYVGGACVVNKRLKKVNSVAIVEDTGGFSGIIVAAHEVGHLLGAVHDGSPPPSYLGGPGARHCRWKDGYIMSDLRHTERGFRWSPCSTEQFHHFLNGETATCLYNLPHEDESLPRVLPGKLLSLDAQCKKDRGTTACFKDERVCAQLFCFDSSSGFCVSYRPAAEGSECGNGKICLNGKCVYDNENSISDYDIHRPDDINATISNDILISLSKSSFGRTENPLQTTRSRWSGWSDNNVEIDRFIDTPTQKPQATTKYRTFQQWTTSYKHKTKSTTSRPTTTDNNWKTDKFIDTHTQKSQTTTKYKTFQRWTTPYKYKTRYTTPRPTTTTTTPITTTTTTTRKPFTSFQYKTTQKPYTYKYTTTRKPFIDKYTTKRRRTTKYKPFKFTTKSRTTTRKPYTFKYTTKPRTTTKKPYSFKYTTKPRTNKWTESTTYRYNKNLEDVKNPNNFITDSDDACEDTLVRKSGSLSCHDFLTNYGNRYCNHRYIQKNCCKSQKELCTK